MKQLLNLQAILRTRMSKFILIAPALFLGLSMLITAPATAQQVSKKFAHITMPDEVTRVAHNAHETFAGNNKKIWRIDTKDWTADSAVFIKADKIFTEIQGMAGHGENLWFYVNGDGLYRLGAKGTRPQRITPRSDRFCKNYEEAYSSMNVDPTGSYLLLYGFNENVAVFDINNDMKPIAVYNDYVPDAYWLGDMLWASALDKVVLNKRKGKSLDNQDFIHYGDNDQTGMVKYYVSQEPPVPKMGEDRRHIKGAGEIKRLIYNKANGDLLLCTSSFGSDAKTRIFKMEENGATPVAEINGGYGDFAAYGTKIVARTGGGFTEFQYGDQLTDAKVSPIATDLMHPPMWKGQKSEPYEIRGSSFMEFDDKGNLWIADGRELFVVFKQ